MSSENTIPSEFAQSTGPLLLGFVLNWGFQGALCVQLVKDYYHMAFPKDRVFLKSLVFGLFLLDIVQSILVAHDMFGVFVIGYGNQEALADVQYIWLTIPMLTGIVSCTVQIFFAYRIYTISGSKIAGVLIIALALMQTVASFICGVQVLNIGDLTMLQPRAYISTTLWLSGSAACDIIIAVFMTYFLSRQQTGFKATQILISRMIRLTIETGSMTAAVAILGLAFFLCFPHNNFHSAPALMLSKLYTITLVTSLNARLRIVNGRNNDSMDTANSESFRVRTPGRDNGGVRPRRALSPDSGRKDGPAVTVNNESEVWRSDIRMNPLEADKDSVSDMKGLV